MEASRPQKKKASKKHSPRASSLWSSAAGWVSVDPADELLLGAEEGGFAGLEVLDDVSLIDADYLKSLNEAAKQQLQAEATAQGSKPGKTPKQQKQKEQQQQQQDKDAALNSGSKRKRTEAAAAEGAGDDVAALKARLQQLEAENKALKKQKRQQDKSVPAAAADGSAEKPGGEATAAAAAAGRARPEEGKAGEEGEKRKSRKELRQEKHRLKQLERKQKLKEQRALAKQQKQQQQGAAAGTAPAAAAAAAEAAERPQVDMSAWSRFCLHPKLEAALAAQGFSSPTPIQDAVLLPAIRDRRNVIGAAQTGSGKTLAFGLPILQVLLQEQEQQQQVQQDACGRQGRAGGPLRALILAPTRELALQVAEHLQALGKVVGIRAAALVGGIAPVKQARLLAGCPPVVVATPGRLWDLIRHGHSHVSELGALSFFVLDEADRMVQQGHYQELSSIMELLPTAERAAAVAAAAAAEAEEQQRLAAAAAQHKKKLTKQQRVLGEEEEEKKDMQAGGEDGQAGREDEEADVTDISDSDEAAGEGEGKEEGTAGQQQQDDEEQEDSDQGEEEQTDHVSNDPQQQQRRSRLQSKAAKQQDKPGKQGKRKQDWKHLPGVRHHLLQTFVFSATLALPDQLHKRLRRGGGGSSGAASLESLMDRISFRERPAIVDLSPSTQLAERVREGVVQTLEGERDAALYYLLARHPGRALVFVNAVSAVRRVAALLQLLGLPAVALHAQQQQRQRLKALDRFKTHPHGVLVATDVAARGLDVPDVQIVVHYQLPASADTYIHRSGRTARTGSSDGVVLAMVTPADASRWAALRRALEGQPVPPAFPIDDRVLGVAKQRVALAAKIDSIQRQDRKAHAAATWARSNAEAAGISLSDSELEDEGLSELMHSALAAAKKGPLAGKKKKGGKAGLPDLNGTDRDSQTAAEKAHAAGQLAQGLAALQRQLAAALATPLQPSISHKFFTGGMSAAAAAAAAAAGAGAARGQGAGGAAAQPAEGAVVSKPHSVLPADAIAETMQLASRLNQSRAGQVAAAGGSGGLAGLSTGSSSKKKKQHTALDSSKARRKAAAALAAAAAAKGGAVKLAGVVKKGRKGANQAATQQAVMARMLMSKNEKKRQRRQGGMVVVRPGATAGVFGRDAQGLSALDVLNMSR